MKLKPCPNCGSKKIWHVHGVIERLWWCECKKCHWCSKSSRLRIIAEILWNRDRGEQHEID